MVTMFDLGKTLIHKPTFIFEDNQGAMELAKRIPIPKYYNRTKHIRYCSVFTEKYHKKDLGPIFLCKELALG